MKIIAINGSPRKSWNTATLLQHALDGAASTGSDTKLIHLYDLNYSGCNSCFSCKMKGGKSYGKCAIHDELTPVLEEIPDADAIILGSPIYFGTVTGKMRCFIERLLFQYLEYSLPPVSLFPKRLKTAWLYTMNVSREQIPDTGYQIHFNSNENIFKRAFGHCESFYSYETRQFEDYSKVVFNYVDPEERVKKAEIQFPKDCKAAFLLGKKLTTEKE